MTLLNKSWAFQALRHQASGTVASRHQKWPRRWASSLPTILEFCWRYDYPCRSGQNV